MFTKDGVAPGLSLLAVCMQIKLSSVTSPQSERGQPCTETNLLGKSECISTVSQSSSPDLAASEFRCYRQTYRQGMEAVQQMFKIFSILQKLFEAVHIFPSSSPLCCHICLTRYLAKMLSKATKYFSSLSIILKKCLCLYTDTYFHLDQLYFVTKLNRHKMLHIYKWSLFCKVSMAVQSLCFQYSYYEFYPQTLLAVLIPGGGFPSQNKLFPFFIISQFLMCLTFLL